MQSVQSFIGDLKSYKKNVLEVRERAEIAALKELETLIKVRVFNENKDTELKSFGTYRSKSYKALRESKGRQTAKKDLQLSGQLKLSIKVGKNQGKNVLGFDDPKSIDIREGQEQGSKTRYGVAVKQIGSEGNKVDIFAPNEFEVDKAFEQFVYVIDSKLAELNNV